MAEALFGHLFRILNVVLCSFLDRLDFLTNSLLGTLACLDYFGYNGPGLSFCSTAGVTDSGRRRLKR
jgi:hypothetical protein